MAAQFHNAEDVAGEASRRSERLSVRMTASLREQSFSKFDVLVSDLSMDGFRCETHYRLQPDAIVWLTIPGFAPLESRVVWANRNSYGCAFTQPLHVAVLEHVARLHPDRRA